MKLYIFLIVMVFLLSCGTENNKGNTSQQALSISDSLNLAGCVSLTSDENNHLVISWTETETESKKKHFYMATFDELTKAFLTRVSIPVEQNVALHEEGMPKIAIKGDGTIIAVYETSTPSEKNKFAGDVRYIVSMDKGKTWTLPRYLHQDTVAGKSHSFATITRLGDGEIGACWLDASLSKISKGRPVKFAKTSAANAFGNEQLVDSVACECCRIAIGGHPDGRLAIAFRDIINDSIRDLSIITSNDNGKNFSGAIPFSNDGWVIDGCPHNGPSVSIGEKNIYVTWFTGGTQKGVYYGKLGDQMQLSYKRLMSAQGRFIQLCQLPDDSSVVTFNEARVEGDLHYNRIMLHKMTKGKAYSFEIDGRRSLATYPVVKALSADKVMVAWSQDDKIYYQVVDVSAIKQPVPDVQPAAGVILSNPATIKTSNPTDPVCGMTIGGHASLTATYQAKVMGFCSDICRDKFIKDPAAFD
ncbi:YHS domain-containing protein [Niabella yanshanensis]|uniref:YHS domain-containing protein n=1 Tax=Niabella yanshanensis TaxID=577386 RepID=A0ABZ0W9E0_9BACT|nr:YHS domain-containing protein [Niabella yanshanensis]WQD38696.1 YHS domain-containing protein [Niabella yanshanensis]